MSAGFMAVVGIVRAEAEIGKKAPEFALMDIQGKTHKLSEYEGKVVVLEWINHGCPFVKKHYNSGNMQSLQKKYTAENVVWLSICSSAKGKQGHMTSKEWQKRVKSDDSAATAVLIDEDGKVGRLYGAKTTPHMYVIDQKGNLAYMGAIDNKASTDQEDIPGARNWVSEAVDSLLAGKPVEVAATVSYGCSVKYK